MTGFNFKVEFAVQMKNDNCKKKIVQELSTLESVEIDYISVDEQRFVLILNENSPSAFQIQELIEKRLKLNSIIRGTGDFFTAVCELRGSSRNPNVFGVARFIQDKNKQCLIDLVIDGLKCNSVYHVGIHEYGDLSGPNFESIGKEVFSIEKDIFIQNQKLNLKKVDEFDLVSAIGRSFVIKTNEDIIGACVIARASKILDNKKQVCACSGKTLWQERESNRIQ